MKSFMQAAVLYGREDLRLREVPVPEVEAGGLLVHVGAATTCGTDLKVFRRGYHAMMLTPPIPFGHEFAGVVVKVGAGVERFAEGDRVVALNSAPCDSCYYCGRDQQNLCENLLFNNGAYAEFIVVPPRIVEKNTLKVPETLPFEVAALTEPLACVVLGFRESGARAGDTMVVIGAGPIGLMFMNVAALKGIRVIAVVKRAEQVATAKVFGAAEAVVVAQQEDIVAAVRALTEDGRGADVVVEAVATPATWEWAVGMVRRGGTVNFFGGPPAGTVVALDTNRLHYGDITLRATFHHTPATAREAFALLQTSGFKSAELITGRTSLDDVPALFERMHAGAAGPRAIKTAVFP